MPANTIKWMSGINKILTGLYLLFFLYFFSLAIQYSPDGEAYLSIFSRKNMFIGREEIGFLGYAWILREIFYNPYISMYVTIIISLTLYLKTANNYFTDSCTRREARNISKYDLLKLSLILIFITTVFSNALGVQLRIGLASLLLVFIVEKYFIRFEKKKVVPFLMLLLPTLFHYGTTPAAAFAIAFYFAPDRYKKKITLLFIIAVPIFLKIVLEYVFSGNEYYMSYLQDDFVGGRALPFTLLFYIVCCIIIVWTKGLKHLNYFELFSLAGIGLVIVFFLDIYIAAKMLDPFRLTAAIAVVKYIDYVKIPHKQVVGICIYLLSFFSFYYYSYQIQLLQ